MIEPLPSLVDEQPPLVEIRSLGIRFGQNQILRNIQLNIPHGQTVAILGESGCGKTILLKTIIGLIRPTEGEVRFDGRPIVDMKDRELTKQRIRLGFLFQQAALFDSMTIGQNVAFPIRQHTQKSPQEIKEIVIERLAEVGLSEEVIGMRPAELSGGMRKRVGLARALALNPELLLYDEPTTGLDPIMSDVINELILHARKKRPVTSVVVTHDMRTARKVADRVVMIHPLSRLHSTDRQIIFDGRPDELDRTADKRVVQFVCGQAGERLMEMKK